MGKGLSQLQRAILKIALEQDGWICADNVLEKHYKCLPLADIPPQERKSIIQRYHAGRPPVFVEKWGNGKYIALWMSSERAATCRAFKRLVARGLLLKDRYYRGKYTLTPEGTQMAEQL